MASNAPSLSKSHENAAPAGAVAANATGSPAFGAARRDREVDVVDLTADPGVERLRTDARVDAREALAVAAVAPRDDAGEGARAVGADQQRAAGVALAGVGAVVGRIGGAGAHHRRRDEERAVGGRAVEVGADRHVGLAQLVRAVAALKVAPQPMIRAVAPGAHSAVSSGRMSRAGWPRPDRRRSAPRHRWSAGRRPRRSRGAAWRPTIASGLPKSLWLTSPRNTRNTVGGRAWSASSATQCPAVTNLRGATTVPPQAAASPLPRLTSRKPCAGYSVSPAGCPLTIRGVAATAAGARAPSSTTASRTARCITTL